MSTTPRTLEDLGTTQRVQGSLPAGFDPAAPPIIAAHWFGVVPDSRMGEAAVVAGMRHEIPIEHITWLRPRAFGTALARAGPGGAA